MKIREIHQKSVITEESWMDIAKAAYAGAVGQKDVFGKDDNKYNAEIEKSKEGADWLIKNFTKKANTANPPTSDNYRKIAQQLLDQMLTNQTGLFKNMLVKMGVKKPSTDIQSFINGIRSSFGNNLRELPELNRALDNLGRTYDAVINQAEQHRVSQKADPELQRLMAGFASIWYNLPKIMQTAVDRSIQSSRYGEQWIDAGNGVEIKRASIYDDRTLARYNNEIFNFRDSIWRDSLNRPTSADIQTLLTYSMELVSKKIKAPAASMPAPDTAVSTTSKTAQQPVMIKGSSGREFQYNDKDKTWSTAGEIISDPRIIQRLNKLALPQFQNRAMGLKTRGAQNNVFS